MCSEFPYLNLLDDISAEELSKPLTEISLTAGQPGTVPGQGQIAGGHRLLDDLLHGPRHLAGPQAGAADEDRLHLVVAAQGDGSRLGAEIFLLLKYFYTSPP